MKILAISGSLRADSLNTKLLHAAGELADDEVEFEVWDGLKAVPPYDQDDEDGTPPLAVARLRSAVAAADAVLFATPEYNSSIPGQLKNALDWVSRPTGKSELRGVPIAVISASTGQFGAVWAQAELRKVLGSMGARVVETGHALPKAHEAWGADGRLVDQTQRDSLREAVSALVAEVETSLAAA